MSSCFGGSTCNAEEKMYIATMEPGVLDVLCGRDKRSFHHEGNNRFRSMIISKLQYYQKAASGFERSNVVKWVVAELQKNGSRFLKFDQKARKWYMLSERDILNKISHALRDKYPPKVLGSSPVVESRSNFRFMPRPACTYSSVKPGKARTHSTPTKLELQSSPSNPQDSSCPPMYIETHVSQPDSSCSDPVVNQVFPQVSKYVPRTTQSAPDPVVRTGVAINATKWMEKRVAVTATLSKCLFPSSFLDDLRDIIEAEDEKDEVLEAINTLDFSDLDDNFCLNGLKIFPTYVNNADIF